MSRGPIRAKAERAELFGDIGALTDHLRAYDFRLGVDDELRLTTLRDHLAERGASIGTVEGLCRWIGPVVCRNPDQQEQLPKILERWLAAGGRDGFIRIWDAATGREHATPARHKDAPALPRSLFTLTTNRNR